MLGDINEREIELKEGLEREEKGRELRQSRTRAGAFTVAEVEEDSQIRTRARTRS